MMAGWRPAETARFSGPSREAAISKTIKGAERVSIAERNTNALAYIEKCERRRQRKARRRQRTINRFMRFATPFTAGICMIGVIMALV